jgi:hypothetical protein
MDEGQDGRVSFKAVGWYPAAKILPVCTEDKLTNCFWQKMHIFVNQNQPYA